MLNDAIHNVRTASRSGSAGSSMADRATLRLSATLLFVGVLLSLLAGILHAARENANDHPAVFAEYASSASWTAVHLGQFIGMACLLAGLFALFYALNADSGAAGWAGRLGAVSSVVALALYGVLQAVDGVALKQAVDAWVRAPEAEKAARFASAETVRWLEWAVRSYQSFILGLALVLFATLIVMTARLPRPIGYLMGLAGLAYIAQGWILGSEGFSASNSIPQLLGYLGIVLSSTWLFLLAWRMKASTMAP